MATVRKPTKVEYWLPEAWVDADARPLPGARRGPC